MEAIVRFILSMMILTSLAHAGGGHDHHEHGHHEDEHEEKTVFTDEAIKDSNISLEVVAPQILSHSLLMYGKILPNENGVAHVVPRFSGIMKSIHKNLGDKVEKGDLLAVVESNQSLSPYEIHSPISGIITKRHGIHGEYVTDSDELFIVADLSEVWVDFQIYRDDLDVLKPGQEILVDLGDGKKKISAKVSYVSPLTDETTQSRLIRAILPNANGELRPGLFITGGITVSKEFVKMAVKREAVHTLRDKEVVFVADGHHFEAKEVQLGRKDKVFIEILSGLNLEDKYVAENSFIVKADIEKSAAGHDH